MKRQETSDEVEDRLNNWGKIFYELRMESGLSIKEIMEQAPISRSFLGRLEKEGFPLLTRIERLLRLYGYEIEIMKTHE